MRALLSNYRQAPRKVRLAADLVRGQTVTEALRRLRFLTRRAAAPLAKLIRAAASAVPAGTADDLLVKKIAVDGGSIFKRYRPRARGRAAPIRKRTSRVTIELQVKSSAKNEK